MVLIKKWIICIPLNFLVEWQGGSDRNAVVEKPELVIADEPTPGLHMEAAVRVLSHFREIADEEQVYF